MKQVQANVARSFVVKQSNRFEIISQVKVLLNDDFPKYVLRTDVDNFYENILHERLLEKINENHILSPFSRKLLRQILCKYKELSGSDKGIPRGVGVSANLAELYMRDIDRAIMSLGGISYYARYVDDIIIIFTPTLNDRDREYLKDVKGIVEDKFKIKLNDSKTFTFDLRNGKQQCELEYLGYKMFLEMERLKLS